AGGPYWQDSDGNGVIDNTEHTATGVGIALSGLGFGLALMRPTDAADSRRYYALNASASTVEFVGVPGVAVSASQVSLQVNRAFNAATPSASVTPLDLSQTPITVPTGPATSVTLNFNSELLRLASNPVTFSAGPVTVSGAFTGSIIDNRLTLTVDNLSGAVKGINIAAFLPIAFQSFRFDFPDAGLL